MQNKKSWIYLFLIFNIFFFSMYFLKDIKDAAADARSNRGTGFLAPKTFMTYELPGISTRTGDKGYTDTLYKRISKDSAVIHLLGLMDEFSVLVGKAYLDGFMSEENAVMLQMDIQNLNVQIAMICDQDFELELNNALFANLKHVKNIPYRQETSALCWEIEDVLKDLIYTEKAFVPLSVVRYFTALKYTLGHYKPEPKPLVSIALLSEMTKNIKGLEGNAKKMVINLLSCIRDGRPISDSAFREFEKIYAEKAKDVSMPNHLIPHGHNYDALYCDYYRVYIRKYERYNSRFLKGNNKKFINRLSDFAFYLVLKNIKDERRDISSFYRLCA